MTIDQSSTRPETGRKASIVNTVRRPTISSRRWTSGHSNPRLVTFSWGAVSPMGSQR